MNLLDFATLVQRFAAQARASAGSALDFTVGSVFRALSEAQAAVALWLQWLILVVLAKTRLATSQGTDCDTFGADYGFTRLPATTAAGSATFARFSTGIAAAVPIGATCSAIGGQSFVVIADTTNSAWNGTGYTIGTSTSSVTVPVQAVTAGSAGNIQAGTLNTITTAIPGVDTVTNAALFTGGTDAETDAAFRSRFQAFINTRSRGTAAAALYAIQSMQQGLLATVLENTAPDGTTRNAWFTVVLDDGSGAPSSNLLSAAYTAVDQVRSAGIAFAVVAPTDVMATISMTITALPGYVKATLIGQVQAAILAYIGTLGIGQSLRYSRLNAVACGVTGVDYAETVLLNGGAADIGGGAMQVVRSNSGLVVVS